MKETRTGDEAVLVLTGEIDIATAGSLREAAQRAIAPPLARLVLDFAGVTFCDSQGLATLIAINKQAQAAGSRLLIINGKPAAQFLYRSEAGELVGLAIASDPGGYQSARTAQRHNVNIVHWRNAGYGYAFMGTIELPRLEKLADKAWRDLGKT